MELLCNNTSSPLKKKRLQTLHCTGHHKSDADESAKSANRKSISRNSHSWNLQAMATGWTVERLKQYQFKHSKHSNSRWRQINEETKLHQVRNWKISNSQMIAFIKTKQLSQDNCRAAKKADIASHLPATRCCLKQRGQTNA